MPQQARADGEEFDPLVGSIYAAVFLRPLLQLFFMSHLLKWIFVMHADDDKYVVCGMKPTK
jgi:hypothetical protein